MTAEASAVRRPRVLLGVTGSVASIKAPELAAKLQRFADVRVVASPSAQHFFTEADLPEACRPLLGNEDEWRHWRKVGDEVLHIELRRWADALVVAPLSANSLAKMAGGLCDNLLTCIVRAWDFHRPLLVAPAMNTFMWESTFTQQHLDVLLSLQIISIPPVAKRLACGEDGMGAMASTDDIAHAVESALQGFESRTLDQR